MKSISKSESRQTFTKTTDLVKIMTHIHRVSIKIEQTQEAKDKNLCNDYSNDISTLFEELLAKEGLNLNGSGDTVQRLNDEDGYGDNTR